MISNPRLVSFFIIILAQVTSLLSEGFVDQNPYEAILLEDVHRLLESKGDTLSDSDLQSISRCTELSELDLSRCQQITDQGISHLSKLSNLKALALDGCHRITIAGIQSLSSLGSLEQLDISQSRLKLTDVYSVLEQFPNLQHLEVRNIRGLVTDGIGKLQTLEYLDLSTSHGGI